MAHRITEVTTLEVLTCASCGCRFAMTAGFYDARLSDGRGFYCPAGHSQIFTETTEKQLREAKRQLASAQDDLRVERMAHGQTKREVKRLNQRAKGGACPHCNRTFVQLSRHIKTRHPQA